MAGPGFPRRGWRFWTINVAALLGLAVTASLGRWQLQRAAQKEAIEAEIVGRAALPVLADSALAGADADTLIHRRVALHGRWLAQRTVYLDNRQMFGRPGFFVLTPLELSPGAVVMVQRGWIPRDFQDRAHLLPVATPEGPVEVAGRVAPPPARLYDFAAAPQGDSPIRQNLDLSAFRRDTGLPLVPWTVVQTGAASEGLQRDWTPVTSGVERHYGYAFQWFGLCALIVVLYAWFQFIRRPRAA
ncbi:SURF1 family protein [Xylophilus sp. GOD-11R]|uniref:SURF1 family protein n=1 Tax=Xylophilus sp. GOD-11R TaxID=3089814 RepID=UPI00298C5C1F|nr:SURF1 family protein [Xylophilus sp. GOD-11R]WPB56599.1 SURF1 family protein [Xylophilus sp. GOD-11R]